MMLAILAEKTKKKKLNERCVLCSAQKYQRSNLSLRMVIGIPGLVKFLLVESGFREFFLTNPKSWALESRIQLSRLESGNIIQVPKTKNLELIQYLKYRMNNMKYRIQDYLGLPYSNYHVSFCFEFDFLSGEKEKKNLNRLSRLFKKIYHILFCPQYMGIIFNRSFSPTAWPASMSIYWNKRKRLHIKENS